MIKKVDEYTYRISTHSPLADGLMFILLGVGALLTGAAVYGSVMWELLIPGLACLAAGILMLTACKIHKRVVDIRMDGIQIWLTGVSSETIHWSDIRALGAFAMSGAERFPDMDMLADSAEMLLGVCLVDPDAYEQRLSAMQRALMKTNLRMGYGSINIPGNLLMGELAEILTLCKQMHPDIHILNPVEDEDV